MAHFESSSVIPGPRHEVFKYVSDISNLPDIMSTDYKIELTSPTIKMNKGSEYQIRVTRFGVSMIWGLIVEEVIIDEQIRARQYQGPFDLWIHTQKFEDHGTGTLLTDIIEYDTPFGLLGKLADDLFVRRDLINIYKHKHQKVTEHFSRPK